MAQFDNQLNLALSWSLMMGNNKKKWWLAGCQFEV
jgi:hypothetical protein